MKKQKSTVRALLGSALTLLLCVSMLVGTTFAWFTDSVTSGSNKIVSGKLDVQLLMDTGSGYADISNSDKPIFGTGSIAQNNNAETLWEPGKTQVAYLAIKNNGNLALKYTVSLTVQNISKDLYEVMKYDIIEDATYGSVTAWEQGGTAVTVGAQSVAGTVSLGVGATHYFALAIHMDEAAGNEYQGGEVNFDLTVLATQDTVEYDSFDNQYDKDASLDFVPVSSFEELKRALAAKVENIVLTGDCHATEGLTVEYAANIDGDGFTVTRADGYTGTVFTVAAGATLTLEDITLDGGAVWTGETDATLQRGTVNSGVTATGNLIATAGNGNIVLNEGAVLQNNVGAHAVSLATRGGGSLTLNGGQIINNQSDSGAIWGGGAIIVNAGSRINGNASTGAAGAIRMVSSCNLTVNGGEINHNKAASDGGVIWGYGASTYTFRGGEMAYNEAGGTGGAIYTGNYSVINISGDFALHDNTASNSGAIRLTDHTSMTMTGGKVYNNLQGTQSNAFNTWNNSISITGGELADDFSFVGGLGLTVGAADIDGIISYSLSTNHNTAYLTADFGSFRFTVNEADEHFANFNFKPADGYVYTAGDEEKLVCLNEGYSTYWDADTGTFRLQAD